jgi:hypothetical protein
MARWLVTKNDTMFAVEGLAELREMASSGRLSAGDMIQPPGASDWLYASEVPELHELMGADDGMDDDLDGYKSGGGAFQKVLALLALLIVGFGGYYMYDASSKLPDVNRRLLGEGGLSFSEMVVTATDAKLYAEAESSAKVVTGIKNSAILKLLAKRQAFYRVEVKDSGATGWVDADKVMPMYLLGGGDVIKEMDPLYNPDRYTFVQNASWMQLPEQRNEEITVFQFMIRNSSQYDVTDMVVVATIKDAKGQELEQVEFRVEGVVPASESTLVGTIVPKKNDKEAERRLVTEATFEAMATETPTLREQYLDGVEVQMQTADFTEASIDIVELRAIPNEPASND